MHACMRVGSASLHAHLPKRPFVSMRMSTSACAPPPPAPPSLAAVHMCAQLLALLSEALGAPLELNLAWGSALWPMSADGALALVTIDLGRAFPRDTPTITLTSTR